MVYREILIYRHHTFLGPLLLGSVEGELVLCRWTLSRPLPHLFATSFKIEEIKLPTPLLRDAASQIDAFLNGNISELSVPHRLVAGTFASAVLREVARIPCGSVSTYHEVAARVGRASAVRAVAGACGANPLALIIPCHRVVSATGIGGYAGGLAAKHHLLELEKACRNDPSGSLF